MILKHLIAFIFVFCFSSYTAQAQKQAKHDLAPSSNPMSCKIEGKILHILKPTGEDSGTVCAKYPCRAKVKIGQVYGCGSSVSIALNPGDIVEMRFAYTLHKTAKIFPAMKVQYPGLKKGDEFIAVAIQHLKPLSAGEYIIYDYELK
jgi:hypothetical protein